MSDIYEEISSGAADVGELIQLPEEGRVFCDWLDVTFKPTEDLSWVAAFTASVGCISQDKGFFLLPQGGVIKHQNGKRWQRLSISGTALSVIRHFRLFDELLQCISQHPHKITRVDASLDLCIDASVFVNRLWDVYKGGKLRLNVLNAVSSSAILGTRFDGSITGTFYAGNRRVNKVTARVYDKQHEVYEKGRFDIGSRVRVEVTVRTDQPTLRDVEDPTALFWHYASPSLLPAPSDAPKWFPGNPFVWEGSKIPPKTIEERIKGVVYGTGDLNAAMVLCGDSIGMFDYLRKLVGLRISERASKLPGWRPSYEA